MTLRASLNQSIDTETAMTIVVSIEEAQIRLRDLISGLKPDDDITITDQQQPVARLVSPAVPVPDRAPGFAQGMITIVSDDDDHLRDFEGYMP